MKRFPVLIALLQVLGVVAYILILTSAINYFGNVSSLPIFDKPMFGMSFFLLVFVTSALICSSLVLGYPIYLFLGGEKKKAVNIVLWSAFWFVLILLLALSTVWFISH